MENFCKTSNKPVMGGVWPEPGPQVTSIEFAVGHLSLLQFVMLSIKYKDRTNTDIVLDCQLTTDILAVMQYNCVLGTGNQHQIFINDKHSI